MPKTSCAILLIGAIAAAGSAALAQTDASQMSAEQLQSLFEKQKTRGLSLIQPQTAQPEAPADAGSTTVTATEPAPPAPETPAPVTTAATEPGAPPAVYAAVAPEEQVNVSIVFDFDSAALRPDQAPKLDTLCQVMRQMDGVTFQVVGHTDTAGTASYNENLSLLRAQEVKRHMVDHCGVPATRLEAVGVGEAFPLDGVSPEADANRRVEFQALS